MRCGIQMVEKTNFAVTFDIGSESFDLDLFFIVTKPFSFSSFLSPLLPLSFPHSLLISSLLNFSILIGHNMESEILFIIYYIY